MRDEFGDISKIIEGFQEIFEFSFDTFKQRAFHAINFPHDYLESESSSYILSRRILRGRHGILKTKLHFLEGGEGRERREKNRCII